MPTARERKLAREWGAASSVKDKKPVPKRCTFRLPTHSYLPLPGLPLHEPASQYDMGRPPYKPRPLRREASGPNPVRLGDWQRAPHPNFHPHLFNSISNLMQRTTRLRTFPMTAITHAWSGEAYDAHIRRADKQHVPYPLCVFFEPMKNKSRT